MGDLRTIQVAMLAYPGAQILDITGPLEMFAAANEIAANASSPEAKQYHTRILARETGPFETTSGMKLVADGSFLEDQGLIDMLMVSGGDGTREALGDQALIAFIRSHGARAKRVVSICSGAFLLAEAGLLKGRRATTHWAASQTFRARYPDTTLDEDAIYVRDGHILTSAGVTAGMDLALAIVAEDFGWRIALDVARKNVLFMLRPGGQSQFSKSLSAQMSLGGRFRDLGEWVMSNLARPLTTPELAQQAGMSERTFSRRFAEETRTTPARFVESLRVEEARRLLELTRQSLEQIATQCGFGSAETMRRSFHRNLSICPQDYRARFTPDTEGVEI